MRGISSRQLHAFARATQAVIRPQIYMFSSFDNSEILYIWFSLFHTAELDCGKSTASSERIDDEAQADRISREYCGKTAFFSGAALAFTPNSGSARVITHPKGQPFYDWLISTKFCGSKMFLLSARGLLMIVSSSVTRLMARNERIRHRWSNYKIKGLIKETVATVSFINPFIL